MRYLKETTKGRRTAAPFRSPPPRVESHPLQEFFERWRKSEASERANYALFLAELCDQVLGVPHAEPAQADDRGGGGE